MKLPGSSRILFFCCVLVAAGAPLSTAQAGFLFPSSSHEDGEKEPEDPFIVSFPGKGAVGLRARGGKDTNGYWDANGNFTEKGRAAAKERLEKAKETARDLYEDEKAAREERKKEKEEAAKEARRADLDRTAAKAREWEQRDKDVMLERDLRDKRWNAGTQDPKAKDLAWATRQREEKRREQEDKRDKQRFERDMRNAQRADKRR